MAQFKDVFSITAKVILALLIISAAIGVGSLILVKVGTIPVGDPDANCQRDTACREAKANVERIENDNKAEWEGKMRELYIEKIHLRDGDAAGDLYVKCTSGDPPQQAANKKRCQALLDRLQKEDARDESADAKAKAKW
jgi:hypothetical protein